MSSVKNVTKKISNLVQGDKKEGNKSHKDGDNAYYFLRNYAIGAFYQDHEIEVSDPLCFTDSIALHPDYVLRRLGLIRQKGKFFKTSIFYDPRQNEWVSEETNNPPPTRCMTLTDLTVHSREDEVPGGIIRVIGDMDFKDFRKDTIQESAHAGILADLNQFAAVRSKAKLQNRPITAASSSSAAVSIGNSHSQGEGEGEEYVLDDITDVGKSAQIDSDDDEPEALPQFGNTGKFYTGKFLRQYLARAVPSAAAATHSLIVHNGTGDIAKQLGRGISALNSDGSRSSLIPLLGVNSARNENFVRNYLPFFTHHLLLKQHNQTAATDLQVSEYTRWLVSEMAAGYSRGNQDTSRTRYSDRQPPDRPRIPVVTVVFGGDPTTAKFDIIQSVHNRWPIMVVEGSGGYADVLAHTIRRVEELAPNAGIDEFRAVLAAVEATTATIINQGDIHVFPSGQLTEEFQRTLLTHLRGDETLAKAWGKYCIWASNAISYQYQFKMYQIIILITGLLTTAFSIIQTFLLLQFPHIVTHGQNNDSFIFFVYQWLNWIIIAFPIGISLMHTLSTKVNSGGRWVSLRSAAEGILKEIYYYRTKTNGYSKEEVAEARKHKEENTHGVDEMSKYASCQERLHLQLAALTQDLSSSECAAATLRPYEGPVPPISITMNNDDGFSDLTPDQYIEVRLKSKMRQYHEDAAAVKRTLDFLNFSIYFFGALGTLLAALAVSEALAEFNLQAWVAFTTACVNALTRYIDYTRLEWLTKTYNKVERNLSKLVSWWPSRGTQGDNSENRHKLVKDAEHYIADEVGEWEKQLKNAMEKMKKSQETEAQEREQMLGKLRSGEDVEKVKKIKDIGFDKLTPEMFQEALNNPNSAAAEEIKSCFAKLNEELGDPMSKLENTELGKQAAEAAKVALDTAQTAVQTLDAVAPGATTFVKDIATGVVSGENFVDVTKEAGKEAAKELGNALIQRLPDSVKGFIKDSDSRQKFLSMVREQKVDPFQITRDQVLRMASNASTGFGDKLQNMPQRELLEVARVMAINEVTNEFFSGLQKIASNEKVRQADLLPPGMPLEDLVSEISSVARLPWRSMDNLALLELIHPIELRDRIGAMPETRLRSLLKRADKYFVQHQPLPLMLTTVNDAVAEIDLADMLSNVEISMKMVPKMEELKQLQAELLPLLSREEMLQYFEPSLHTRLIRLSHMQMVHYVKRLAKGAIGCRIFDSLFVKLNQGTLGFDIPATLRVFLHHKPENQQRFVIASADFSQIDVNRLSHTNLLKKLGLSSAVSKEMLESLKVVPTEDLKKMLSSVKATLANSYASRMFDRVADELTSFDVRSMFTHPQKVQFIGHINELQNVSIDKLTRQQLVNYFPFKSLQDIFDKLTDIQLRQFLSRSLHLVFNSFTARLFRKAANSIHEELSTHRAAINSWNQQFIDRIVISVTQLTMQEIHQFQQNDALTEVDLLNVFTDVDVRYSLQDWPKEELIAFCRQIKAFCGERVIANLFEAASRTLQPADLYHRFDTAFSHPIPRKLTVAAMTGLIRSTEPIWKLHEREIEQFLRDGMAEDEYQSIQSPGAANQDDTTDIVTYLVMTFSENEGEFKKVITKLYEVLCGSMGYFMFLKLCTEIHQFDLRSVVQDFTNRQLLASLVHACRTGLQFEHGKMVSTGSEILTVAEDQDDMYDKLVNDLRLLRPTHIVLVFQKMQSYLSEDRTCGKFFQEYERSLGEDESTRRRNAAEREAINLMRFHIHNDAQEVYRTLDYLDADRFTERFEEEKRLRLGTFIHNDNVLHLLTHTYTRDDVAIFFTELKALVDDILEGPAQGSITAVDAYAEERALVADAEKVDVQNNVEIVLSDPEED